MRTGKPTQDINSNTEVLKKLSDIEKRKLRKTTELDQEQTDLFIDLARSNGVIGQVSNDTCGIHFEYLTGYSRNTLGDGLSMSELENNYHKLDKVIEIIEKMLNDAKSRKNEINQK